MKPLRIFLCDLTYDTITLSTDAFPLNIGYIAAYIKSKFGSKVEIKLFKYIEKLENALEETPPDILAMSNYAWNRSITKEISKIFSAQNPNGIVVWGGPNFPLDLPSQEVFFRNHPMMDVYVPVEGEVGFSNLVEKSLSIHNQDNFCNKILEEPIEECIIRSKNGKLLYANFGMRIKNIDDIPSPYLTGLLDEFFDGKLSPMIQTNRGCPFSCTFCVDGSDLVKKVNSFSNNRVKEELNYIAKHVTDNMHSLHISDLNFGMYPKDLEVCDYIQEIQEKYDYPRYVKVTSGKNKKERIIPAIKKLGKSVFMAMSVQSMDNQVLSNIRRDNISTQELLALGPAIKEQGLHTASDVILGLPGETYASHLQTIRELIHANIDWINIWTLMLLDGSELNTPSERKKWDLITKYRLIPRDFAKLKNGKVVVEIEEVVIGSNTLSFDEYVKLRVLALIVKVSGSGTIFAPLFKFLNENDMDVFDLLMRMLDNIHLAPVNIQNLFKSFEEGTINELWTTPEEIEKNYDDKNKYNKLLLGQEGQNLIYYYHALIISDHMSEWIEFILQTSVQLLNIDKKLSDVELKQQFLSISNYSKGLGHNIFGKDRMETNPEFIYDYDILTWLNTGESSLTNFKNKKKLKIWFKLTDEQFTTVEDNLNIYGHTSTGRSQLLKIVAEPNWWRQPILID